MRANIPLVVVGILAMLALIALATSAQTPPPTSGNWEIHDDTVYDAGTFGPDLTIEGYVMVHPNGSLTLRGIDLVMDAHPTSGIVVFADGMLVIEGGSVTSPGNATWIILGGGSSINGTLFTNTYGIRVQNWGNSITNCTIQSPLQHGVSVTPVTYLNLTGPIVVEDNVITNPVQSGVTAALFPKDSRDLEVSISRNQVFQSYDDAISVLVNTDDMALRVEGNRVRHSGGDGINLDVTAINVTLRLDGNDVEDVDGDGLYLDLQYVTMDLPGIDDLRSVNCDGYGVRLVATNMFMFDPVFRNWTVMDCGAGGILLENVFNATLLDSTVYNPDGDDYIAVMSTLGIYGTAHRKGRAEAVYALSRITSHRSLDLTFEWQNGVPCAGARIDLVDSRTDVAASATTDEGGYFGNVTVWDWYATYSELFIRFGLDAILRSAASDLRADVHFGDTDLVDTITMTDLVPPALDVDRPRDGAAFASTDLVVSGNLTDGHSGPRLVQVSYDPRPDWTVKDWVDATGTDSWTAVLADMPEGVHTIHVRAFDVANYPDGTYAAWNVTDVRVDLTPPIIVISSPAGATRGPVHTRESLLVVEGELEEAEAIIYISREDVVHVTGEFSYPWNLLTGTNLLHIVATDRAGNVAVLDLVAVLDTTPPVIALTGPADGSSTNDPRVVVEGTVDEPLARGRILVNGEETEVVDGTFASFLLLDADGRWPITIMAEDLAGNLAIETLNVTMDTLPPSLDIISPMDGLHTSQVLLLVTGVTPDGATVLVDGRLATLSGDSFHSEVSLVQGLNYISIDVGDAAGNGISTVVAVVLDTISPWLVIDNVTKDVLRTGTRTLDLTGTTEPGVHLSLFIDGVEEPGAVYPDGSFIHTLAVRAKRTPVTVRVTDIAGNERMHEIVVVLDEVAPAPAGLTDPVVVAAVAGMTFVSIAAAMSVEVTRYSLLLLVLPLYARLRGNKVLDNKTRLAIHGLVIENPGLHYNEIIREFGLTNGVAAYHLDVLEREGFLRSVRDGTLRRFFSTATKVPQGFKLTPEEVRERIIEIVDENPGIPQKMIVDELGIGRTVAGYHLNGLVKDGYLDTRRKGRFTLYERTKKRWQW
jgi:predicted transcriptional regulator